MNKLRQFAEKDSVGFLPPTESSEDREDLKIFLVYGKVLRQVGPNTLQPLLLLRREFPSGRYCSKRPLDSLARGQQTIFLVGGMLHHRDDVGKRLVVLDRVSLLQILFREALGCCLEFVSELRQRGCTPIRWTPLQDPDRLDVVGVLFDESCKCLQVVLR